MIPSIGVGHWECSELERSMVNSVLDSGRLSYGEMSKGLEASFSRMHGSKHGILSNSGTSSLHVAVQAAAEKYGWAPGSKIIVPALTFVATVNVILHNGFEPALADVDEATYNISPAEVSRLIDEDSDNEIVCVIPVHLFGQPADMTGIRFALRNRPDVAIIEDSCECMGVSHRGQMVGSMGDIGCFSFYVAHLMTTGVGGIATTNDPELAALMRSLVNHGRDGIYFADSPDMEELIAKRFRFERVGHSFRITELEAALGLAQIDRLPSMIEKRTANANRLSARLASLDGDVLQLPRVMPGNGHAFMMYPIVLIGQDKYMIVSFLERRGIETRDMLPITNQPVYAEMPFNSDNWFSVAEWVNQSGFYVGCHQYLGEDEMDYIGETIESYFEGVSDGK